MLYHSLHLYCESRENVMLDNVALLRQYEQTLKKELSLDHVYHILLAGLLDRLDYIRIQPKNIIVLGWHAQYSVALLKNRYPDAVFHAVNSVAQLQTISTDSVDLIISPFALAIEPAPLGF